MDKPNEIREAAKWLQEYWDSGHSIVLDDVYTKELLNKVSIETILQLGFRLVKQPARTFLEYPDKEITESRIDTVILLYGEKE